MILELTARAKIIGPGGPYSNDTDLYALDGIKSVLYEVEDDSNRTKESLIEHFNKDNPGFLADSYEFRKKSSK